MQCFAVHILMLEIRESQDLSRETYRGNGKKLKGKLEAIGKKIYKFLKFLKLSFSATWSSALQIAWNKR